LQAAQRATRGIGNTEAGIADTFVQWSCQRIRSSATCGNFFSRSSDTKESPIYFRADAGPYFLNGWSFDPFPRINDQHAVKRSRILSIPEAQSPAKKENKLVGGVQNTLLKPCSACARWD